MLSLSCPGGAATASATAMVPATTQMCRGLVSRCVRARALCHCVRSTAATCAVRFVPVARCALRWVPPPPPPPLCHPRMRGCSGQNGQLHPQRDLGGASSCRLRGCAVNIWSRPSKRAPPLFNLDRSVVLACPGGAVTATVPACATTQMYGGLVSRCVRARALCHCMAPFGCFDAACCTHNVAHPVLPSFTHTQCIPVLA